MSGSDFPGGGRTFEDIVNKYVRETVPYHTTGRDRKGNRTGCRKRKVHLHRTSK